MQTWLVTALKIHLSSGFRYRARDAWIIEFGLLISISMVTQLPGLPSRHRSHLDIAGITSSEILQDKLLVHATNSFICFESVWSLEYEQAWSFQGGQNFAHDMIILGGTLLASCGIGMYIMWYRL